MPRWAWILLLSLAPFLRAQEEAVPGVPMPPPLTVEGLPNRDYEVQLAAQIQQLEPEQRKAFFRLLRSQERRLQGRIAEMEYNRDRAISLKRAFDREGREGSALARKAQEITDAQRQSLAAYRVILKGLERQRRVHDAQKLDAEDLQADLYAGFQFSSLYRDPDRNSSFFAKSKPFVALDIRQTLRWPGEDQWMDVFGTLSFQASSKEKSDAVDVITTSGNFRGELGAWWMQAFTENLSWGIVGSVGLVGYTQQELNPDFTPVNRDEFRNRTHVGLTLRQETGALRGSVAEVGYARDPLFVHQDRFLMRGRVVLTQFGGQGASGDFYIEGSVNKGRSGRDEAVLVVGLRLSTLSFFRSLGRSIN